MTGSAHPLVIGLSATIAAGCAGPSRPAGPPLAKVRVSAARPAVPPQPTAAPPVAASSACPALAADPPLVDVDVELPTIVDASGAGLARFHRGLAVHLRGGSRKPLRIAIYGDSNMTRDWISGELRRALQARYGDAGHGFVAAGKPWNWYIHTDVEHDFFLKAFDTYAVSTAPAADRMYGFAGIAVDTLHAGATTWFSSSKGKESPVGRTFSSAELYYLARPKAGRVTVKVDGKPTREIDAAAEETAAAFERIELEDASHRIDVVATSWNRVRLFGMVLERDVPGVVVDSLGVGAMTSRSLATQHTKIAEATLAHRGHDLVIFALDTGLWADAEAHANAVQKLIELHRRATPGVSILLLAPPDHATSSLGGTDARILRLIEQKRALAKQLDVAFFDFRAAMGASIVEFSRKKLAWTDYIHFTEKGGRMMGARLAEALHRSFVDFVGAHPDAGCP